MMTIKKLAAAAIFVGMAFIAPREAYMSGSGQAVHTSEHFRITAFTPHKKPVDSEEYNRRIRAWQGQAAPFLRNLSGLIELRWAQAEGREMTGKPGGEAGRRLVVTDKYKAIASTPPFYYQVRYGSKTYPGFTEYYVFELLFTKTPGLGALTGMENYLLGAIDSNFEYARVLSCTDEELRSAAREDFDGKTDEAMKELMKGALAHDPAALKRWKNSLLLAAVESNNLERAGFWLKEGAQADFAYAYPGSRGPEMTKLLISNGAKAR